MDQAESAAIALAEKIQDSNGKKVWAVQAALHTKARAQQSLNARMLLKVCRKCIKDGFHLEEYLLDDVPLNVADGVIMSFLNKSDCNTYLGKEDGGFKIKEIDFWSPKAVKEKLATPLQTDKEGNQQECGNCFKGVYVEISEDCYEPVYSETPQAEA